MAVAGSVPMGVRVMVVGVVVVVVSVVVVLVVSVVVVVVVVDVVDVGHGNARIVGSGVGHSESRPAGRIDNTGC
jgi:hypothetical protein